MLAMTCGAKKERDCFAKNARNDMWSERRTRLLREECSQ
jgi:hypothetical protein